MGRIKLLLFALLTIAFSSQTLFAQGLILSELCDPRQNYLEDRFIEICNTSSEAIELDGWSLEAVGNTDVIFTWSLSGTIEPGEALVAGDASTVIEFQVDFPAEAWSESNGTWNGKVGDGARLIDPDDNVIDEVVAPGTLFENDDMVRNPDILSPSPSYVESEWSDTPAELPTDGTPGEHEFEGVVVNPQIGEVTLNPARPIMDEPFTLSAMVTDSESTISLVRLNWWHLGGSVNTVAMESDGESTYTTVTPVPLDEGGNLFYFTITAYNELGDSTVSDEESIQIATPHPISNIQGIGDETPVAGFDVVTTGIVTAIYWNHVTIQESNEPRDGIWLHTPDHDLAVGDSLRVQGYAGEVADWFSSTTMLSDVIVHDNQPATTEIGIPELTVSEADVEGYEGNVVTLSEVMSQSSEIGDHGEWLVSDETGSMEIGGDAVPYAPIPGTLYQVTGAVRDGDNGMVVEPRVAIDIVWLSDPTPASIISVHPQGATQLMVTFSENLDETTAEISSNYTVDGVEATGSTIQAGRRAVLLDVEQLEQGEHELVVNGVEDEYGNATVDESYTFFFTVGDWPDGYYDDAMGLNGEELRVALHDIIDDHDVQTYSEVWDAYYTSDVRPDGYVWDIYSDTPGETPPYLYTLGDDQGGTGAGEGTGYTREHIWPKSWYGGEVTPMYTDVFVLYPCDGYVNGQRGNLPYGEVDEPTWTSLNGSRKGPNSTPGYSGNVFEPIDEYKGDLARAYFYFMARYYSEDDGWPGSPMVDGANLEPWAEEMMLAWHTEDPVSQKEVVRNNAIFDIQENRNPFVDHPEWVMAMLRPTSVGDQFVALPEEWRVASIYPNPFNPSTTIQLNLPASADLSLVVYNINGRQVASLADGPFAAGQHSIVFHANGLANGIYFVRALVPGKMDQVKKVLLVK
ncbi:endonuclease [bacterium]|nr:endonuclease [bacterium]